jgi:hypothetical protein
MLEMSTMDPELKQELLDRKVTDEAIALLEKEGITEREVLELGYSFDELRSMGMQAGPAKIISTAYVQKVAPQAEAILEVKDFSLGYKGDDKKRNWEEIRIFLIRHKLPNDKFSALAKHIGIPEGKLTFGTNLDENARKLTVAAKDKDEYMQKLAQALR